MQICYTIIFKNKLILKTFERFWWDEILLKYLLISYLTFLERTKLERWLLSSSESSESQKIAIIITRIANIMYSRGKIKLDVVPEAYPSDSAQNAQFCCKRNSEGVKPIFRRRKKIRRKKQFAPLSGPHWGVQSLQKLNDFKVQAILLCVYFGSCCYFPSDTQGQLQLLSNC